MEITNGISAFTIGRLLRLHQDNRPFGTHPEMDDVDYWHNRAKQLGAVWSRQRTEFLINALQ